jgi:thiol-disulfide isomerase/thioredoxin
MWLRLFVLCGSVGLTSSLFAANFTVDLLKAGSRTYTNVTIIGANATDLYFTHSQGISNVKLKYVDVGLQKRFDYDPKLAAEAERQQIDDDSRFQNSIASNLVSQALASATAARKAASSSPDNLADSISSKSLLGKPAPSLEVDKWLGDKPAIQGKCVLLSFWAPWSVPCRRYIPLLNNLHNKYAGRLVVIGLTSDTQAEVDAMETKLEFASAIDTKAKLAATLGITSVPSVLLVDAKGIIRYQGHPAALDERILQNLLPKAPE